MSVLQIPCAACGAVNRVLEERLDDVPVCGRCRTRLIGEHPVALDDAGFERFVGQSDLPVLVDFGAAWCGPCRSMAPQFERAAREHAGQALFAHVDTDAAHWTSLRLGIQSIPALLLFRSGREVARQVGAMSAKDITTWLESESTGRESI